MVGRRKSKHELTIQQPKAFTGPLGSGVSITATGRTNGRDVSATYKLPTACYSKREDMLKIGTGDITAHPQSMGVGSSFLPHIHRLFEEAATRADKMLMHEPAIAYDETARSFFRKFGYSPPMEFKLFGPGGRPTRLPENEEEALRLLLGKYYRTAEQVMEERKAKKAK